MRWYLLFSFLCAALLATARPVVQPAVARKARPPGELIPYRRASQWGYANAARRLVIRPQYDYAERFDHGLARVWKNDKCGFIDPRGKVVVPIAFDRVAYYLHEIQHEYQRGRRGYELRQLAWPGGRGRVVVFNFLPVDTARLRGWARTTRLPASLLKGPAAWFDESWLQSAGEWGLYDSTGRVVLAPNYAYLHLRADGLLNVGRLVRKDAGYSQRDHSYYEDHPVYEEQLMTRQGRVLLKGQAFSELRDFHFGQLLVASSGGYESEFQEMALIDTAQAPRPYADQTWYTQIERLGDDGFIGWHHEYNPFARHGDPFDEEEHRNATPKLPTPDAVLLGRDGQPIGTRQYVNMQLVAPGRARAAIVTDGSVWEGLLNTRTGQWVLPPIYEALYNTIGAGRFLICQQKRWGIIDSTGRVLVAPRYEALKWVGGAALTSIYKVQKNGKWGVIDYRGRELIAPRYDEVNSNKSGYDLTNRQEKRHNDEVWIMELNGEADRHGRLRIPVMYEDLRRSQDEKGHDLPLWEATRAGRLVLLDTTGRLLLTLGASKLSNFLRNRADVYTRVAPDSLTGPVGLVQLDTTGHRVRVRRLPLPPAPASAPAVGELLGETWRSPTGQLLVRYTRFPARPLPPDSSAQTANRCWLTTADSTVLLPPIYCAIEPQQLYRLEKETPIGPFLRVRRGQLFGVVTAEGRPVLPVSYPDVLLPYGISGVFWVQLPTGYAAIDAQQRVLRHTHSDTPPRLPAEFANGYGLLTVYSPQYDIIPVGYVDELGRPFFSEKRIRYKP